MGKHSVSDAYGDNETTVRTKDEIEGDEPGTVDNLIPVPESAPEKVWVNPASLDF